MTDQTLLRSLRWAGIIEGTSYLLLLFIAMPLKYVFDQPLMVTIVGSAHGFLWIAYLAVLAYVGFRFKWSLKTLFLGGVASVLPFGPWIFDAKILAREYQQETVKIRADS